MNVLIAQLDIELVTGLEPHAAAVAGAEQNLSPLLNRGSKSRIPPPARRGLIRTEIETLCFEQCLIKSADIDALFPFFGRAFRVLCKQFLLIGSSKSFDIFWANSIFY